MPETRKSALRNMYLMLGLVWVGLLAYVALEQVSGYLTFRDFAIEPLARMRVLTTYYWLPWLLLAPVVLVLSRSLPIRPGDVSRPVTAHIGLFLILTIAHGLVVSYVYANSDSITDYMATFYPWQHSGHFLFGDYMLLFDVVIYSILAASMNIRGFLEELKRRDIDSARLSQKLTELRLRTLRMQLNPHFLFNALNSVSALIAKQELSRARQAIQHISRFLRLTLDDSLTQLVTLGAELEFIHEYLEIVRLRFGERLVVEVSCDPHVRDAVVPAMLLQPLVENAVGHAFAATQDVCRLSVVCRQNGDRLQIRIEDNGVGANSVAAFERGSGLGIRNVRERLKQIYGEEHSLQIDTQSGVGTTLSISFPIRAAGAVQAAVA